MSNAINDWLGQHSLKPNATPVYLFAYNEKDDKFEKLSWDSSFNHLNYCKGLFESWSAPMEQGGYYTLKQVMFGEVTN